jgi:hypothetical protein
MGVVARQQDKFACPHVHDGTTVDLYLHASGGDKMRGNDMSGCRQERFAIICRESSVDAPGRSEFRLEEDPSRQPNHTQYIRKRQVADPNEVARAVLAASTWSVLALTCHIELFVQAHYVQSIAPREELCPLFKDVFKFHWKDESRHVVLDELEWQAEHAKLSPAGRDQAVNDLIALVAAVDAILQAQSACDADYFIGNVSRSLSVDEATQISACVLDAYRWQYIVSGVQHPHFGRLLAQMTRIQTALAPIIGH